LLEPPHHNANNCRVDHNSPSFSKRKKDPQQDQQVHHQEDAVDPGCRGVRPLRADRIEVVAILALAELPLDRDALQVLLKLLRFQLL
jgi:hypothetical protein